ncbi:MAG: sulfatase-like hydrolase/transferase [Bdellovibrionota bacterium]
MKSAVRYRVSLKDHAYNLFFVSGFILAVSYLLRLIFVAWSLKDFTSFSKLSLAALLGGVFDLTVIVYALIPFVLMPLFLPTFKDALKGQRIYRRVFVGMLSFFLLIGIFLSVGEVVFWNEFHSRFNFIAVDYLVYTHEVIKNIWESYHIVPIVAFILAVCIGVSWYFSRWMRTKLVEKNTARHRLFYSGAFVLALSANIFFSPSSLMGLLNDFKLQEISKNGIYSLFQAYFANELDYEKFYVKFDRKEMFDELRTHLQGEPSSFATGERSIRRDILRTGDAKHHNVILVSMESFSATFMKSYGNTRGLTPNLDYIESQSLNFRNMYATGTRTVRGLEALMLSVPPTPGQSILRRPKNKKLYSLADYFEDYGYATDFLYGGYSYFDNMGNFFSNNEMEVWDRSKIDKSKVTFSNAWGVCDENLYTLSLERADANYKAKKPFFQLVMTTSNHRPYTYPSGKIDIPSGTGRDGAVKYSDYAIGEFMAQAKTRPWFKNTIFIFVADHDASVSGKVEVPVNDYRIPFMVYAPGLIEPREITPLASQIDVVPTILGLLNFSYQSHFYGSDLLSGKSEERALISNYQTVGLLKDSILTLLSPNQKIQQFNVDKDNNLSPAENFRQDLLKETVAYYQTAHVLYTTGSMEDKDDDKVFNFSPKAR